MHDQSPKKMPFIFRLVAGFWRGITWIRQAIFNTLFLILLILVVVVIATPEDDPLPEKAPLYISLNGQLVDQESYISPSSQLLGDASAQDAETNLRSLIKTLRHATGDQKITGLVLQLDNFAGGGISKMQELGDAILDFKASGKPVIAYSDSYSQQSYFIAAYADEIYMHNMGNILLTGFGLYRNYYKEALDKLEVNFHVFKVGEFKDFVEPYIRNSMSDASREHNSQWLSQLWLAYTNHVETQRQLAPESLNGFINSIDEQMANYGGDIAKLALETHLVDFIGTRLEYEKALADRFGESDDDVFLNIPYGAYKKAISKSPSQQSGNIGLIVASGTILDGHQPEGTIGGDSLSELIRQAREDEDLKALVLRVDSGGGSAFASELIRNELEEVRKSGLPVVVSMGSVAASGGYWISMAADEVWATPNTITGSIGVFGLMPTLEKSIAKIGVHTDGLGTTKLAGALRMDRPLSPIAAAAYQQGIEAIYDRFLNIVAQSRNTTTDAIHQVAQGRVWTGMKAKELGLVDELGFLNDAINSAANKAKLDNYQVKQIKHKPSAQEQLIKQLLDQASSSFNSQHLLSKVTGLPPQILNTLTPLVLNPVAMSLNNPNKTTYALCLDCIEL